MKNKRLMFVLLMCMVALPGCWESDTDSPGSPLLPQAGAVLASRTFVSWEGTVQAIQGNAVEVGAGPQLWALSADGGNSAYGQPIVRLSADGPPVGVGGLAVAVESSPEGVVFVINAKGNIYRYDGAWTSMTGLATDLSVGTNNDLWVLGIAGHETYGNEIWHYTADGWRKLPGFAARISVALDGTLYVINKLQQLYRYDGSWELLPGLAQDVAAHTRDEAWVVADDGRVWHVKNNTWADTGVPARVVAVENSGAAVAADTVGRVSRLIPPQPNGEGRVKVLTFNTGPDRNTDPNARIARLLPLAEFAKTRSIEIVGLQERVYKEEGLKDGELLRQAFAQVGYPMYVVQVVNEKHEANVIASRYPFVPGSYGEHRVGGGANRIVQRIAVETFCGRLWVANIHTNVNRSTAEAIEILDVLRQPSSYAPPWGESLIVMGDFNVRLAAEDVVYDAYNGDPRTLMRILAESYTESTLDPARNSNFGLSSTGYGNIDWIISRSDGAARVHSCWVDNTVQEEVTNDAPGVGRHPVIVGLVQVR